MSKTFVILCAVFFLMLSATAQADDDKIIIHGFGGWVYGVTDGHSYRQITEDGVWDHWEFGLNINAFLSDDVRVNVQLFSDGNKQDDNVDVDYAFVEYALTEHFKIRAGKVKQPFGVYGEVRKVGIVRTFYDLPNSVYGHDVFLSDGYTGVGFIIDNLYSGDWGLYAHAYAGSYGGTIDSLNIPYFVQRNLLNLPVPVQPLRVVSNTTTKDVLGLYASIETPLNGMKIGGSVFRGDTNIEAFGNAKDLLINGFLEYNFDPFLVRTEVSRVRFEFPDGRFQHYDFGFLEAGFKVSENVQPVFRYDITSLQEVDEIPLFVAFPELPRSEEFTFGVNVFLSSDVVLRTAYHLINGYQYVTPTTIEGYLGESDTKMFTIGMQYSF